MMRMKTKLTGLSPLGTSSSSATTAAAAETGEAVWEMRPGGMLVQKRDDTDHNSAPAPLIRIRVKYGSISHEITIPSQATFGELKKKVSAPTGLHHEDQKMFFKGKERESKAYLDISGVKDKSKIVLVEDPISQEKRFLELRRNAKMEKAAKSVSEISLEVDRFAGQVSAFESVISKGGKVAEKDLVNLIELLMNELIKLDAIVADGDVKLQRKMQVKRVQKYVETLDMLKAKNSMPTSNGSQRGPFTSQQGQSNGKRATQSQALAKHQPRHSTGQLPPRPHQKPRNSASGTVVTTQWETFDSAAATNPTSSPPPLIPLSPTSASGPTHSSNNHSKFSWDFFD